MTVAHNAKYFNVHLKSDRNPFGRVLLYRLVSTSDRLLVDDDLCRLWVG